MDLEVIEDFAGELEGVPAVFSGDERSFPLPHALQEVIEFQLQRFLLGEFGLEDFHIGKALQDR